jgi:predicted thioesterase
MEITEVIQPGMVREGTFTVEERHLAPHLGSGSLRVLATPAMIAFMERVAHELLIEHVPEGQSSVGTRVDVQHLAPTPLGERVRVRAEVLAVDGIQVSLLIQAWDEYELIGEGQHLRVIIDHARFLKRVAKKIPPLTS